MFVEKLTKEQLCKFFAEEKYDLSYLQKNLTNFMSHGYNGEEYLYVSISGESMSVNNRLYDFEGSTVDETRWRRFLYEIYGEEYKNEYEKYLKEDMSLKLFRLTTKQ